MRTNTGINDPYLLNKNTPLVILISRVLHSSHLPCKFDSSTSLKGRPRLWRTSEGEQANLSVWLCNCAWAGPKMLNKCRTSDVHPAFVSIFPLSRLSVLPCPSHGLHRTRRSFPFFPKSGFLEQNVCLRVNLKDTIPRKVSFFFVVGSWNRWLVFTVDEGVKYLSLVSAVC